MFTNNLTFFFQILYLKSNQSIGLQTLESLQCRHLQHQSTSGWLFLSVPPFSSALPYWSSWKSFLLRKQSGRCNEWIREPFFWDMLFCQQWTTDRISDLLQKQNKDYTDGLGSQPVNCNTKLLLVRKLSIVPEMNYEKLPWCPRKRMLSDLELKMEKMFNIVVFHHHK